MASNPLNRTQRKLESLELEHLRQLVAEQHEQIERLQFELQDAHLSADMWNELAQQSMDALHDENFATHRAIGINKAGETMVIALS